MSSPATEIETFKRRHVAIIPFLFSLGNIILACIPGPISIYNPDVNYAQVYICLTILSLIHLFYTAALLLAPRFLYRGMVWIKVVPWIVSSAGLCAVIFFSSSPTDNRYFYCCIIFFIQLVHYFLLISSNTMFKPFERRKIPNLLAKFDLTDPNAKLETVFGPPISIPSIFPGQEALTIRYGSQALKVQPQQSLNEKQFVTSSSTVPNELPPAYSPPEHETSTNSSSYNSLTDDKSQYDIKK